MRILKTYFFLLVSIVACSSYVAVSSNITDDISNAIKTGNASELTKHFNTNLDITILGNSNSYSKSQAEMIIKDFFKKYPPKSFKVIHQGTSADGSQFSICNYVSSTKSFRVYFLVKKFSDKLLIQQLKFESE